MALYTRYMPLKTGKGWLVSAVLGAPCPRVQQIVQAYDGRRFLFDSKTKFGYQVYFYGGREKGETDLLRRLITTGDLVVDVGANEGWYTTLFARLVSPSGKVLAVEPIPSTFAALIRNIQLEGIERTVIPFQLLCGDREAPATIYEFPSLYPGLASARLIAGAQAVPIHTSMRKLDRLCAQEGVDLVTLLKLDVEGSELSVLKGASGLLRDGCIESIMIEANDERSHAFGYEFPECVKLISSSGVGYKGYRMNRHVPGITPMTSLTSYEHGDNLLFVKERGGMSSRVRELLRRLDRPDRH